MCQMKLFQLLKRKNKENPLLHLEIKREKLLNKNKLKEMKQLVKEVKLMVVRREEEVVEAHITIMKSYYIIDNQELTMRIMVK